MASVIDVRTLSKEEQYQLVLDILKHNSELRSKVNNIVNNVNEELSMEYIEKLVNQDFERYDDVFRRLA
jgi:predicted transcriptional regulator